MKKILTGYLRFAGVIVFSLLMLVLMHYVIIHWQAKKEQACARNIMTRVDVVSHQIRQTIGRNQLLKSTHCNDELLEKMRSETWRASFTEDIGILHLPGLLSLSAGALTVVVLLSFLTGSMIVCILSRLRQTFRSLEYRLNKAIQTKALYLEYQPLVRLRDCRIVGAEALVRWRDSHYGQVSPEQFIELADRLALSAPLTRLVITRALVEMSSVLRSDNMFSLSINLSGQETLNENTTRFLDEQLRNFRVPRPRIKIEITEKNVLDFTALVRFTAALKRRGYQIALDDFGTGSSNLVWLRDVPCDDVKIDKVFIGNIEDENNRVIFTAILKMVSALHKGVVIEGVETEAELAFIRDNAPDALVQGWYFYKSLSATSLRVLLAAQS
ncbi:EAL domain-containing protein [Trabulsiella odontotermitis]|uniref:EAL domain-containing protein n=1 Tax=Trabulsiella odontotermitis TaxID=379893 RepID=UPI000675FC4E|nr:EAL domain-containing protein [Trabulsiella odontotermitis]